MVLVILFAKIFGIVVVLLSLSAGSLFLERRISAWIQDRLGPNRVGPFGLLQPVADILKLLSKEDLIPANVNRLLYTLAPILAFLPPWITFAVIPFGASDWTVNGSLAVGNIGIGLLFFLAITSLSAYGMSYGGWASFSKYSFMGGIRSSAQIISFEIAMAFAVISVIMSSGTVHLNEIVLDQRGVFFSFVPNWFCFRQPLAFLLFWITAFAETNRLPFDMPEAEPELVGGYHTEYSGMKFALFYVGEYTAMATISAVMVTLFLGGWHFPGMELLLPAETTAPWLMILVSILVFLTKVLFFLFFFIWVRWTLPRLRWDQLMQMGWRTLIPLSLLNILITALFRFV